VPGVARVPAERLRTGPTASPGSTGCTRGSARTTSAGTVYSPPTPGPVALGRWVGHPTRARRFFEWLAAALRDFTAIGDARHTDDMLARTALALGTRAADAAEHSLGGSTQAARPIVVATRLPAGSDRFA
jgi:hypothetical protein